MGSFDKTQILAQPQELPRTGLEELLLKCTRVNKSNSTLVIFIRIFASKVLVDITNKGRLKPYLRQNQIWMKTEVFSARPVSTVGFLTQVHPKYSRLSALVDSLRTCVSTVGSSVDEKEHYLARNLDLPPNAYQNSNPVPLFTLYSAKRSVNHRGGRLTTEVINIRCATEDKAWLSRILVLAALQNEETFKFVPQGTQSQHTYETVLYNHII